MESSIFILYVLLWIAAGLLLIVRKRRNFHREMMAENAAQLAEDQEAVYLERIAGLHFEINYRPEEDFHDRFEGWGNE